MDIVNLSHNDDIVTIVRKCNLNFKNIVWQLSKSVKNQQRVDLDDVMEVIASLSDEIATMESVTIPNAVAAQVAAQDIPGLVEQATIPPIGAYLMSQTMPAYDSTTWQQVGTVQTSTNVTIPIWERMT